MSDRKHPPTAGCHALARVIVDPDSEDGINAVFIGGLAVAGLFNEDIYEDMAKMIDNQTHASDMLAALEQIADIAEGSTTANSLPNIARLARAAIAKGKE
jgi:hypothetical protein